MSNSFKTHHVAPTLYDAKGRPYCEAPFTPKSDTKRYICVVPPEKVIPVIFLPGIMGSNLKFVRNPYPRIFTDNMAWRPDNGGFMALTFGNRNAAERRVLLDPANTTVDNRGDIPDSAMSIFSAYPKDVQENWKREFNRRGWGTVMLSSYGAVLAAMEFQLNRIYYRGELSFYWKLHLNGHALGGGIPKPNSGVSFKGHTPVTEAEIKHAARYWYPVHAVGYNWLQSNKDAGGHVAAKLREIIGHYKKQGYRCDKAILVTHSMGGLAARATCHAAMGAAENLVLGIVHGEQPATGAATAYRRMHAGFEVNGVSPIGAVAARALGWSGREVTAVLSQSPGGLQLLPNHLYPPGWLKIAQGRSASQCQDIHSLPKTDPYAEIYRERDAWWRLINPEWIDPAAKAQNQLDTAWERYHKALGDAESFHRELGTYYHPTTHTHHGADKKQSAWGKVRWTPIGVNSHLKESEITQAPLVHNNALGSVNLRCTRPAQAGFSMGVAPQDEAGDATVPACSARAAAAKAEFSAEMSGFEHQGSFEHPQVQDVTLYSILKIAQKAS